jgi:L-threonylcarbamoyladenylate synthase
MASKTRIIEPTQENIEMCSQLLQEGKLIGMPTETVYGLGANALDVDACKSIFTSKGRPLTDPLIVHVHSTEQAMNLADSS